MHASCALADRCVDRINGLRTMPTPTGRWADPKFQRHYFFWRRQGSNPAQRHHLLRQYRYQRTRYHRQPRLSTYLKDLQAHGHQAIECPFGSTTIYPEKHAIAQNEKWDIATFEIPEVFVNAADRSIDTQHRPLIWPPRPRRVQKSDVVIYGGVPGVLREEKGSAAELPFQWVGAIERHAAA